MLLEHGWVKNILFLADRASLVTQAKRSFVNLFPDLSVTNLCEEKDNFAVKQHLKYVELYANGENYVSLTNEDTLLIREELAPLIIPDDDESSAVRFDALMYGIELVYFAGKGYARHRSDLLRSAELQVLQTYLKYLQNWNLSITFCIRII